MDLAYSVIMPHNDGVRKEYDGEKLHHC